MLGFKCESSSPAGKDELKWGVGGFVKGSWEEGVDYIWGSIWSMATKVDFPRGGMEGVASR